LPSAPRSISRHLLALATPIIGLLVLNVLMLAVDAVLCGRLPEAKSAISAVNDGVQVVFLLMVAMLGLLVGTIALVARAFGAGDHARVQHVLVQSTQLTLIVGVFIGLAGAALADPIMVVLGASDTVRELGVAYLRPLMLGTPMLYLGLLYAGVFRGVGNTRIPFLCALVANVVNAILNYALVLGHLGAPSLGVTGSAIGTDIAQALNAVMLVWALRRGAVPNLHLPLVRKPIDRPLARDLLRIGWPAMLDMLVLNAGFLTAIIMLGRIDPETVTAHSIGMRVQSIAFVPGLGIAQATGAMVGQSLGAGDAARASRVVMAALGLCVVIMVALAIPIVVVAEQIVPVFLESPDRLVEAYAVDWMRILGVTMLPTAAAVAFMGMFQGSGSTLKSLSINFYTTVAIQIPLAWLLGFALNLGADGVWWSFPLSGVVKALWGYVEFRRAKWAVTGLTGIKPHHPVVTPEA
jgi:putative MATE family efflux protein